MCLEMPHKAPRSRKSVASLQSHLGYWLRAVSNHVSQSFADRLAQQQVTVAEWVVLRTLYDYEPCSPSKVAEAMGMTRGAISKLVDRLSAKGMITKEGISTDRRFQQVALTTEARSLVPVLAAIADDNDQTCFACLREDEQRTLLALMTKLVDAHNLQKIPTE